MTEARHKLKLGKGVAFFVKSQLRRLPQEKDIWEADFLPIPKLGSKKGSWWMGMVISHTDDFVLATVLVEQPPSVNDLATLVAHAMRRPLMESAHRPAILYLRDKPEWFELLPHLKEIGIEVVVQDLLPKWDEAFKEFVQHESQHHHRNKGTYARNTVRPIPETPDQWLEEILLAWSDAEKVQPVSRLMRSELEDADLFHLAPLICLKFRGKELTGEEAQTVTEVALANYVVNTEPEGIDLHPQLAFALCYVAAHLALDLVDEQTASKLLDYCEEQLVK